MNKVFHNEALQQAFQENGYVVVDLLDADDIAHLNTLFSSHAEQYGQPFHTSHFSADKAYKQQVHETVASIVGPKVTQLVDGFRPVFGNFMIKQPDPNAFMPLHADWTYVDESQCRSIAVWVPLVDTTQENGCLGVIPKSHKVMNAIRGPRIQQTSYQHDKQWVKDYGVLLPMKAGQAVIYDHALMHYSPPNKSQTPRPALNLSMTPANAEMRHYCIPEGADVIEVYKVDDPAFFINYDNFKRPETNSLVNTLPADTVKWMDDKMENFGGAKTVEPKETPKQKSLLARIFGI